MGGRDESAGVSHLSQEGYYPPPQNPSLVMAVPEWAPPPLRVGQEDSCTRRLGSEGLEERRKGWGVRAAGLSGEVE